MELRAASLRFALTATLLLAGGCATTPIEPGVLALPGTGKSLDEFNADNLDCRKRAATPPAGVATSGSWTDQQRRYDFAYIQCMYAKGHRVPVPGQFTGAPSSGPPPVPSGAAPPPPPPGAPPPPPSGETEQRPQ